MAFTSEAATNAKRSESKQALFREMERQLAPRHVT
jgi:hypothetical protein